MKILILSVFVLISMLDLGLSQSSPCIDCTFSYNNSMYNFLPMSSQSGYLYKNLATNDQYWMNICCHCTQCNSDPSVMIGSCQITPKPLTFVTGLLSTTIFTPLENGDNGAVLTYSGGQFCSTGQARTTKIKMLCSPNEDTNIVSLLENPACVYNVIMKSKYACPVNSTTTSSSSTTGGITSNGSTSGGTISGGTISGGTISGGTISGGTISGGTISGGTISGATISGATISSSTTSVSSNSTSGGSSL